MKRLIFLRISIICYNTSKPSKVIYLKYSLKTVLDTEILFILKKAFTTISQL